MTECTATLTTATFHSCTPGKEEMPWSCCGGQGSEHWWDAHVELDTIKCDNRGGFANHAHGNREAHIEWRDDAPGATPHKPPLVTDEEWEAARTNYLHVDQSLAHINPDALRAALEAAAKVRQSHD